MQVTYRVYFASFTSLEGQKYDYNVNSTVKKWEIQKTTTELLPMMTSDIIHGENTYTDLNLLHATDSRS